MIKASQWYTNNPLKKIQEYSAKQVEFLKEETSKSLKYTGKYYQTGEETEQKPSKY